MVSLPAHTPPFLVVSLPPLKQSLPPLIGADAGYKKQLLVELGGETMAYRKSARLQKLQKERIAKGQESIPAQESLLCPGLAFFSCKCLRFFILLVALKMFD